MIKHITNQTLTPAMATRLAAQKKRQADLEALAQITGPRPAQERQGVNHSIQVVESLKSTENMG